LFNCVGRIGHDLQNSGGRCSPPMMIRPLEERQ
jgi:hypothetical protein